MKKENILECDVKNLPVAPDGIENYQWFVSNTERTEFAIDLMYRYTRLIREQKTDDENDIIPYKILGVRFLVEMVAVFQGDLLRERANQNNVELKVSDYWHYWSKLFCEQSPSDPDLIKALKKEAVSVAKNNFQPLQFFQKVLKYFTLKKNKSLGAIKIRPITDAILRDCIITTQRTQLNVQHASEVSKTVIFCNSERWFREISDQELENALKENNLSLEDEIMEMLTEGYKKYGIELKDHSYNYIKSIVSKGAAMARIHYQRLLKNNLGLPSEIWTGTSNQFWDSLLRTAVKKCSGTVTGHDHGSGWSYLTHPMRGINELWGCDNFVTFNDFHASEMTRMAPAWPLYEDTIPKIRGVKNKVTTSVKSFEKFQKNNKNSKKTAFLMSNPYDNDMGRIGPGVPNNYLVDLQARMITYLKEAGYDVVLKMHPESPESPPAAYERDLGAIISWDPFTKIIEQADVTIFKCIYTTSFTDALATNVPIMVFDNFGLPWTEKGQELIEKRCSIYSADYKDCRAIIDKDKFLESVEDAMKIEKTNNHEFYETYFM